MPLELMPYQVEGSSIISTKSRFGLHDEMGLGKSSQVWRAVDLLIQNKIKARPRGIIVCPANLRENWINEHKKFSHYRLRVCKGEKLPDLHAWMRGVFDVLVISYERAAKWAPRIRQEGELIDFVAMDEAHYIKNKEAARTKSILGKESNGVGGLIEFAAHVWHVTGTPMANDPMDIYTFLKMCRAIDMNYNQFMREYFTSETRMFSVRTSPKEKRLGELRDLIASCSIRRTADSVKLDLPPLFATTYVVDGDTSAIKELFAAYPDMSEDITRALEEGGLSKIYSEHIASLRRLVGEAKAYPYAQILIDELKSGACDKKVVFGIHVKALEIIKQELEEAGIGCVLVNGTIRDPKVKQKAVDDFQSEPWCRVFLGNMISAGTGLTLTAANHLDLFEASWVPAENEQAMKRIHRISQTRNAFVRFIALANSVDVEVMESLAGKAKSIAKVNGHESDLSLFL